MMASEDEDVRFFAVNATIKLGNMALVLIDALREGRRSQERNPLPRRARLTGETHYYCSSNKAFQGEALAVLEEEGEVS